MAGRSTGERPMLFGVANWGFVQTDTTPEDNRNGS